MDRQEKENSEAARQRQVPGGGDRCEEKHFLSFSPRGRAWKTEQVPLQEAGGPEVEIAWNGHHEIKMQLRSLCYNN